MARRSSPGWEWKVPQCVLDDPGQRLHWYESTPGAERGFCNRCGTMMFFRSTRWPGELHIALAHFTTPIDRTPQMHVHWADHVPWADVDPLDGLSPENNPDCVEPALLGCSISALYTVCLGRAAEQARLYTKAKARWPTLQHTNNP